MATTEQFTCNFENTIDLQEPTYFQIFQANIPQQVQKLDAVDQVLCHNQSMVGAQESYRAQQQNLEFQPPLFLYLPRDILVD